MMTQQEMADLLMDELLADARNIVLAICCRNPHDETMRSITQFGNRWLVYVHQYGRLIRPEKKAELEELLMDLDKIIARFKQTS